MNVRYLLGIAIAAATVVAACGDGATDTLSNGQGGSPTVDPNAPAGADGTNDPSINSNPSDPAATNSPSHTARGAAPQPAAALPPPSATTGADRPEILIGAAFAGAFVFAQVIKRLVD